MNLTEEEKEKEAHRTKRAATRQAAAVAEKSKTGEAKTNGEDSAKADREKSDSYTSLPRAPKSTAKVTFAASHDDAKESRNSQFTVLTRTAVKRMERWHAIHMPTTVAWVKAGQSYT
jgi:hypothetical protein